MDQNEKKISVSNNNEEKTHLLFKKIVEWQSSLNEARLDPQSQVRILENLSEYTAITDSQLAVNKLKRKFNKLFLENLLDADKEILAKKLLENFHKPCTKAHVAFSNFVIENFGYDENCFKFFSQYMGYPLVFPAKPLNKILNLTYLDPNEPDLPLQFTMATASVAVRAPISSNAWNYPNQEDSSFAQYSQKAMDAAFRCSNETDTRQEGIINKIESRSFWSKKLQLSDFRYRMVYSKLANGDLIQNCGRRSFQLFFDLTRKRTFDTIAFCSIEKRKKAASSQEGDHEFIIARSADDPRWFILDAWNGAKLFRLKDRELHLRDLIGNVDDKGNVTTKPFNPKTQLIRGETYNIYPLDKFERESIFKNPDLIQLLKEFHEISTSKRQEKMLKALQIITFIEDKSPLFEMYDGAIHDLYDQMMYLTAKERKKGLKYTPTNSEKLCPLNQALKDLDKTALKKILSQKRERITMTSCTILHAIKAAMLSEDMEFYEMVEKIQPPILPLPIFIQFDSAPEIGLKKLTEELFEDFPF